MLVARAFMASAAILLIGQFVFGDAFVFATISRWRVA